MIVQESLDIPHLVRKQRKFFKDRATLDISVRRNYLKKLKDEVSRQETAICNALHQDLKKSEFEAKAAETQFILAELNTAIKKLASWSRPKKVLPSLANFPSTDIVYNEPYGQVLIIAPWNYPFQLAISPLIGAVAAGNTAVIKPSELTPHTSAIVHEIITNVFPPDHVKVIEGGVETSQNLLKEQWDYIFFTGSVQVGKIVYQAAAQNLTPVTLELGGKNPCIVDETAPLKLAAKRITWGKFLNGGQTCIAPDYILIHESVKKEFIDAMKNAIEQAYGADSSLSPDYPRIVNQKNFERLATMLKDENIVVGGQLNKSDLFIAPTIIDEPELDSEIMKDEIFGPVLPVISYNSFDEVSQIISKYEKPLSLYVFSSNIKRAKSWMRKFSFGGGAINDTIVHIINKRLPFGGVGHSGIGAYHGKKTFEIFSHQKSVVKRANWLDLPLRYAPYASKMKLVNYIKHLL
jgi:aldehyde dehydrogenase (NAD+)